MFSGSSVARNNAMKQQDLGLCLSPRRTRKAVFLEARAICKLLRLLQQPKKSDNKQALNKKIAPIQLKSPNRYSGAFSRPRRDAC